MAVYKIFPTKDNYISSFTPTYNYGRDEILEISSSPNEINRSLIEFDSIEISNVISKITGSFTTNLKMYLSSASTIPANYNIDVLPLSQSWVMGTGRNSDNPNPVNGSCWNYSDIDNNILWSGGNGINYGISQSFDYQSLKDLNCDITPIIDSWFSGTIENYGLLIKYPDIIESGSSSLRTNFFSSDTHTIYPPHLEFQWNDVIYSSSLNIVSNDFYTTITNNKAEFNEDSIQKFIIKNRDRYPARRFQTSSVYLENKILPEESYWLLKDAKTEEIIIDYGVGTKIGADDNGNYFNVYMNGLQPERYYQLLIKTTLDNEIFVIDNPSNNFKIVR